MASDNEASCVSDPNFAVICSFLECFGKSCGITYPDINSLQEMLEDVHEVKQPLIDLHIKLLRKARKTVSPEKWERSLVKFCHTYSNQDGWELERFGYKKARIAVKLRLLKVLLESQFDLNPRFKLEVNKLAAEKLRVEPLGRDKTGLSYWFQLDEECNIRVYREDLDEENWELVASDREGVVNLINSLSDGEAVPLPENEDSNSLEISEKPIIDTGQESETASPKEETKVENNVINGAKPEIEVAKVPNPQIPSKDAEVDKVPDKKANGEEDAEDDEEDDDEEEEEDEDDDEEVSNEDSSKQNSDDEDDDEEEDDDDDDDEDEEDSQEASENQEKPRQVVTSSKIVENHVPPVVLKAKIHVAQKQAPWKAPDEITMIKITKSAAARPNPVETTPVKSIETPVITTSPLKLVNIQDLQQPLEDRAPREEKFPSKPLLPFQTADSGISLSKFSIKPIDKLAANLSRIQSEKLEKPGAAKLLEKIAENLARSSGAHGPLSNGDDDKLQQEFAARSLAEKASSLGATSRSRGMDLSTSPRGWENPNDHSRPMDYSGIDLSSRKIKKPPSELLASAYRAQEFQHREMDLSTRKIGKPDVANLAYDSRTVILRNHQMVTDLSKKQMYPGYEVASGAAAYHNTARIPAKEDHRLANYKIVPDPSKIASMRMPGGPLKRPLDMVDDPQQEILKRMRAEGLTLRNPMDKRTGPLVGALRREDVVGPAIEEPVMMVQGEGSGSDCDAVNPDFGEAIEEPVIFFYGSGAGRECDTGNPGDETSSDNKESNESKKEACGDVTTTISPGKILPGDASDDNEAASASAAVVTKSPLKINTIFSQANDTNASDNCQSTTVSSVSPKSKFKPTLGIQVIAKSTGATPKKSSRWDVGRPEECDSSIISTEGENISTGDEIIQTSESRLNAQEAQNVQRKSESDDITSTSNQTFLRNKIDECSSSFGDVEKILNPLECQPDSSVATDTTSGIKAENAELPASEIPHCDSSVATSSSIDNSRNVEPTNKGDDAENFVAQKADLDDESGPRFFFGPNCVSYTPKTEEALANQAATTSVTRESIDNAELAKNNNNFVKIAASFNSESSNASGASSIEARLKNVEISQDMIDKTSKSEDNDISECPVQSSTSPDDNDETDDVAATQPMDIAIPEPLNDEKASEAITTSVDVAECPETSENELPVQSQSDVSKEVDSQAKDLVELNPEPSAPEVASESIESSTEQTAKDETDKICEPEPSTTVSTVETNVQVESEEKRKIEDSETPTDEPSMGFFPAEESKDDDAHEINDSCDLAPATIFDETQSCTLPEINEDNSQNLENNEEKQEENKQPDFTSDIDEKTKQSCESESEDTIAKTIENRNDKETNELCSDDAQDGFAKSSKGSGEAKDNVQSSYSDIPQPEKPDALRKEALESVDLPEDSDGDSAAPSLTSLIVNPSGDDSSISDRETIEPSSIPTSVGPFVEEEEIPAERVSPAQIVDLNMSKSPERITIDSEKASSSSRLLDPYIDDLSENQSSPDQDSNEAMVIDDRTSDSNGSAKDATAIGEDKPLNFKDKVPVEKIEPDAECGPCEPSDSLPCQSTLDVHIFSEKKKEIEESCEKDEEQVLPDLKIDEGANSAICEEEKSQEVGKTSEKDEMELHTTSESKDNIAALDHVQEKPDTSAKSSLVPNYESSEEGEANDDVFETKPSEDEELQKNTVGNEPVVLNEEKIERIPEIIASKSLQVSETKIVIESKDTCELESKLNAELPETSGENDKDFSDFEDEENDDSREKLHIDLGENKKNDEATDVGESDEIPETFTESGKNDKQSVQINQLPEVANEISEESRDLEDDFVSTSGEKNIKVSEKVKDTEDAVVANDSTISNEIPSAIDLQLKRNEDEPEDLAIAKKETLSDCSGVLEPSEFVVETAAKEFKEHKKDSKSSIGVKEVSKDIENVEPEIDNSSAIIEANLPKKVSEIETEEKPKSVNEVQDQNEVPEKSESVSKIQDQNEIPEKSESVSKIQDQNEIPEKSESVSKIQDQNEIPEKSESVSKIQDQNEMPEKSELLRKIQDRDEIHEKIESASKSHDQDKIHEKPESLSKIQDREDTHEKSESLSKTQEREDTHEKSESLSKMQEREDIHEKPESLSKTQDREDIHEKPESLSKIQEREDTQEKSESISKMQECEDTHEKPESLSKMEEREDTHEKSESLSKMQQREDTHEKPESLSKTKDRDEPQEKSETLNKIHVREETLGKPESLSKIQHQEETIENPEALSKIQHQEETFEKPEALSKIQHQEETFEKPEALSKIQHQEETLEKPEALSKIQHQEETLEKPEALSKIQHQEETLEKPEALSKIQHQEKTLEKSEALSKIQHQEETLEKPEALSKKEDLQETPQKPESLSKIQHQEKTPEKPESLSKIQHQEKTPEKPESLSKIQHQEKTLEEPESLSKIQDREETHKKPERLSNIQDQEETHKKSESLSKIQDQEETHKKLEPLSKKQDQEETHKKPQSLSKIQDQADQKTANVEKVSLKIVDNPVEPKESEKISAPNVLQLAESSAKSKEQKETAESSASPEKNLLPNKELNLSTEKPKESISAGREETEAVALKSESKKEASKRLRGVLDVEDFPPTKSKPPNVDFAKEDNKTDTEKKSLAVNAEDSKIDAKSVVASAETPAQVVTAFASLVSSAPTNPSSTLQANIEKPEKTKTQDSAEVISNFVKSSTPDAVIIDEKPSEIQSVDVKYVDLESDDSMGIENDSMFDTNVDDVDPLACTEEDLNKPSDLPIASDPKVGIRVKPVKDLFYEGWKLDSPEPPPPPPVRATASRKRRNSAHESNTDECTAKQEAADDGETGGKRMKLRGKRTPDMKLRKSVEQSRKKSVSSEDEASKAEVDEIVVLNEIRPKAAAMAKARAERTTGKPRGRPRGKRRRGNRMGGRLSRPIPAESAAPEEETPVEVEAPVKPAKPPTPPPPVDAAQADGKKKRKKRKMVLGLEVGIDIQVPESTAGGRDEIPVRQSRRIAQLKIKEEADKRRIEEETIDDIKGKKDRDGSDKKKRRKQKPESEEEPEVVIKEVEREVKAKKKRKKKKSSKFNEANPWQSSSGSSTEEEHQEDEDEDDIESEGSLLFKSDHEFSPESDLEKDDESEPLRRARTAQKAQSDVEEAEDEYACQKCGKADHPEWILLCDTCDKGWHCSCLRPALMLIPEGDWFCPPCQHTVLVNKLRDSLKTFDTNSKKHENEVLRKKRLAYVGISLDNVLHKSEGRANDQSSRGSSRSDDSSSSSSESSSSSSSSEESEPVYQLRERRCANTYKFNEYDDMINAAIQAEVDHVRGAGNQGRGKDIATIVNAEKEEAEEALKSRQMGDDEDDETKKSDKDSDEDYKVEKEDADEEDESRNRKTTVRKGLSRKKHRKLNSLDISSEDDPESDEDFKGSSSDEEEDFDDQIDSSDDSYTQSRRRGRRGEARPVRRSTRAARKTRYDEDFINDDSDDSDRPKRKKSKSVWDGSDSEDSDNSWRQKKKRSRTAPTPRFRAKSRTKTTKKKKRKRIIEPDNASENEEAEAEPEAEAEAEMESKVEAEAEAEVEAEVEAEAEAEAEVEAEAEAVVEPAVEAAVETKIETKAEESVEPEEVIPPLQAAAPSIESENVAESENHEAEEHKQDNNIETPIDDEEERPKKKKKESTPKQKKGPGIRRKIVYGGLNDDNPRQEEETLARRTRGRKINYQDIMGSDSEEELKKVLRKTEESEDEFVVHEGEDPNEEAEKDSDSGDIYSPKKEVPKGKAKSPKAKKPKKSKSPGGRKSLTDNGTPKERKKPGPKPGSKNRPRQSSLTLSPLGKPKDSDSLTRGIDMEGSTMSATGSVIGEVPEGSLTGLTPEDINALDDEDLEQMMMEDEEYGRRQLELAAIEIARKKQEEREAKKLEKARLKALEILAAEQQQQQQRDPNAPEGADGELPKKKKRGRRSKAEILAEQMRRDGVSSLLPGSMLPTLVTDSAASAVSAAAATIVSPNVTPTPTLPTVVQAIETERSPETQQMPIMALPDGQLFSPDGSPIKPKRRGRGKGKKTLALEAARAAEAAAKAAGDIGAIGAIGITGTDSNPEVKTDDIPNVLPTPGSSTSGSAPPTPPASVVTSQGLPPTLSPNQQPQPQPPQSSVYPALPPSQQSSVITRMLQSQPVSSAPQSFTAAAAAMGHKYFGGPPAAGQMMPGPRAASYEMPPRGRIPSPYRQPGQPSPMPPHFAAVRSGTPPMRMRVPGAQLYHTPHHPMDPSPSGGGPISINSRDRSSPLGPGPGSSPAMIPPAAGSPLAKGGPTPPPPPYVRGGPALARFPDNPQMAPRHQLPPFTTPASANHNMQQPSPPPNRPPGNFSPYHPPPPPNYHYGAYPPPPPMTTADDAAAYQGSPYSAEHFSTPAESQPQIQQPQPPPQPQAGPQQAHANEAPGPGNKQYDEEGTGEFGGLVSYFSSQREDDLDS